MVRSHVYGVGPAGGEHFGARIGFKLMIG